MIDGFTITFAGLLQTGAVGIVFLIALMIFNGKLVSRKVHEERVNDAKEQAQLWRQAHEASETARRENESLAREGLETSRMVLHLVRTIRNVAAGEDEDGVAAMDTQR